MSHITTLPNKGPISNFVNHHYKHFNAAALVDDAECYKIYLKGIELS